jgi:hypothetical protein
MANSSFEGRILLCIKIRKQSRQLLLLHLNFLTSQNHYLNMKKTVLGILAGAALTFSMASCGEKLLTDEQVQAEIQKGFDAGKASVETEMDAKCQADFETRVTAEVDRLKAEAAAAAEAAATPATGK